MKKAQRTQGPIKERLNNAAQSTGKNAHRTKTVPGTGPRPAPDRATTTTSATSEPIVAIDQKPSTISAAIAGMKADISRFTRRDQGRRKLVDELVTLANRFKPGVVDLCLPPYADPRDMIPAALDWAQWMTSNGGAAFLYVRYSNRKRPRLCGLIFSNESLSKGKCRWARTTGALISSLHIRRMGKNIDVPFRLSQLVLPALSSNPEHPPLTVATGALQPLYDEVMAVLAEPAQP
jgi:hypothetical protein